MSTAIVARWFHWISTDGVYIRKIVDGVQTTIAGPLAIDPAVGDTLLLAQLGLALELWRRTARLDEAPEHRRRLVHDRAGSGWGWTTRQAAGTTSEAVRSGRRRRPHHLRPAR